MIQSVPTVIYPVVQQFFTEYAAIYSKDWRLLFEGVKRLHPEYCAAAKAVAGGHYYLANNVFIMKTDWFRRMCRFAFDILLFVDDDYRGAGLCRGDRYAGYLFEYLYSVFVFRHAKEMRIAYDEMTYLT